jgi:hypothetical protein
MVERAMLYIGVTKVIMANGTRKRMILTDWALAY